MYSNVFSTSLAFSLLTLCTTAQITLTGCHLHEGQEVCLLPGGAETTITNAASSPTTLTPNFTAPNSISASSTATAAAAQTTAITDCHTRETTQYCFKGDGEEVQVRATATATGNEPLPTAYTGCHSHGQEMFCIAPDGEEVEVEAVTQNAVDEEEEEESKESEVSGANCHFHAGVEHCVGSAESTASCEKVDREYNIPLRIGLLFVMFVTSAIGVYLPFFMRKVFKIDGSSIIFTIGKQFGTGVIVSTALVHLLTHAQLMFSSDCVGELAYEATPTAISTVGAFLTFLIEYMTLRLANRRKNIPSPPHSPNEQSHSNEELTLQTPPEKGVVTTTTNQDTHHTHNHNDTHIHENTHNQHPNPTKQTTNLLALEAGIIFHSLLLGLTLVVTPDSSTSFLTLFTVILFHQAFEGLALGSRLPLSLSSPLPNNRTTLQNTLKPLSLHLLPLLFALTTPLGMGIGISVLDTFNGNDRTTLIVLGTLDAFSAGILIWTGMVGMWARDWMYEGGDWRDIGTAKTAVALASLGGGFVFMGVLGKWA